VPRSATVATPPLPLIGKRIAEKAKAAGVEKVAFDRAGFAYHGRVKALAEAAREAGLQF
jgi:large subunit ribosomal protein L18